MTYEEALDYVNDYAWSSSRPGLERTRELLGMLGDPQKKLRFVHVAGTNGKGSTCAMLERVLREAGFRTGLYPSPYLEDFRERIQISGQMITKEDMARITGMVKDAAERMADHPSHFELITAIGMIAFLEQGCDIVVLEVGMGGELDSTNIIDPPEAAVICNIGLDHTEYLGDTIEKIAQTKCGIIKPSSAVVAYPNVPSVMEIIRKTATEKGDRIYETDETASLSHDLSGQTFRYEGDIYRLSLLGNNQLRNASVVLETVKALRDRGYDISDEAVKKGLLEVSWPARFEVLSHDPLFILDGGHNPQCAEALAENIETYLRAGDDRPSVTFLIGMLADKDYHRVLEILRPYGKDYVCITPDNHRALPAEELAAAIRRTGVPEERVMNCATAEEGIAEALKKGTPVISFGSLYAAGTIRRLCREVFFR